jgi:rubrerythrin
MYRECLSTAKDEGNQLAVWSFDVANRVAQVHAKGFAKASEQLENNKQLTLVDYYICSICGNTVEDAAPERCPMCG